MGQSLMSCLDTGSNKDTGSSLNKDNNINTVEDIKPTDNNEYVYKSCQKDYIVVLKKLTDTVTNESRLSTSGPEGQRRDYIINRDYAKYRANKLQVVKIYHKIKGPDVTLEEITNSSYLKRSITYRVGETVTVEHYDYDPNIVQGPGIHYFKTEEVAMYYEPPTNYSGMYKSWYDSGEIKLECWLVDGQLHGKYKLWHTALDSSVLKKQCMYNKGKLHGIYKTWNPSGLLNEITGYVNGKKHGNYTSWYTSGIKWQHCTYIEGELQGVYKSWHTNGQRQIECRYIDNKIHGTYQTWHLNGNKGIVCEYVNGKKHGMFNAWHFIRILSETPDNIDLPEMECEYIDDKIHGVCKKWHANGQLRQRLCYENGVIISEKTWDFDGNNL